MKHLKYFKENNINNIHNIQEILNNYLECALFTEHYDTEIDDKSIHDFSNNARNQAIEEIEWFIDNAGDAIDNISDESIGHDIWLSRNGTGSGFFDRSYDDDIEELLMVLSRQLGEISLEVNKYDTIDFYGGSEKYKNFDIEKYQKDRELGKYTKKYNL